MNIGILKKYEKTKEAYAFWYNAVQSNLGLLFFAGAIIGALLFIAFYGVRILDFTYTDWIYVQKGDDIIQHQLGFEFFRYADWKMPIGFFTSYGYPNGISIVYTDSIPIFAIIFKAFSGILPTDFQYFGLWGIMSFMLQAGLSCVIMRKYIHKLSITFAACPFFVYSTGIIWRMYGHTALAGHWIILLAFYVCIYQNKFKSLKSRIIWWSALTALSVTIHAYFLVMVGVIMVGFLINDFIIFKKFYRTAAIFFSAVLSTLFVFWLLGGFYSSSEISEYGLGQYSMNLNSIFNSTGLGRFLAPLPMVTFEQVEGFQYLGFGFLLMLPIAGFFLLSDLFNKEQYEKIDSKSIIKVIPALFVALSLTILALSPKVTFNLKVLFDYTDNKFIMDVLSPFRASGRLFWPVYYMIYFVVIIYISKKAKYKSFVTLMIIICLGIQIYDLSPLMSARRGIAQPSVQVKYESSLQSDFWDNAHYKHLEFLTEDIRTYEPLAIYAAKNKMTMNNGNIARKDSALIYKNISEKIQMILNDEISDDTIYAVPIDRKFLEKPLKSKNITELKIDGYYIYVASSTIKS